MTARTVKAQDLALEEVDDVDSLAGLEARYWMHKPTQGKGRRKAPARAFLKPEYVDDSALARELGDRASAIAAARTSIGSYGLLVGGSLVGAVAGGLITSYVGSLKSHSSTETLLWVLAFVVVVSFATWGARGYLLHAPKWSARASAYDRRAAHLDSSAPSAAALQSGDRAAKPKRSGFFVGFIG